MFNRLSRFYSIYLINLPPVYFFTLKVNLKCKIMFIKQTHKLMYLLYMTQAVKFDAVILLFLIHIIIMHP